MKRNIYLIAIVLIATISANASSLYLRFTRQANYTVNIDGFYYQVNKSDFRVPSLRPGRHTIIIASFPTNCNPYRRAMPVVIFNGPLMVREASDIFASVDGCGFHIDKIITHRYNENRRRKYHYRYNEFNNQYEEFDSDDSYGDNQNNQNNQNEYQGDKDGYNRYMNRNDFEALKNSISVASFDNTKRSIAKNGISVNRLSISQIKELIDLFSFESSKLEIAKYAYNYTDDKARYYELTDSFSFDSSKREIANLNGKR